MRLQVAVGHVDDVVRITAAGEIDAHTSETLDAAVDEALALPGRELVVDLGGVPFMDSMGLRVLVRAQRVVSERGSTMRIVEVRPSVARALDHAGLTGHLTIEEA